MAARSLSVQDRSLLPLRRALDHHELVQAMAEFLYSRKPLSRAAPSNIPNPRERGNALD